METKVIVNTNIHKTTKISKAKFLKKVENVKSIRTRLDNRYISFYLTSLEEHLNLKRFQDLVNEGIFDFDDGQYVFSVDIPIKLYNWFKTNSIGTIERQITNWLAATYHFDNDQKRAIMDDQLYPPLLDEIKELIKTHYFSHPKSDDFEIVQIGDIEFRFLSASAYEDELNTYTKTCVDICGTKPPEFLNRHCEYEHMIEFGVNPYHNFEFYKSYFREDDWEQIINSNSKDTLFRAESRDDYWQKWKHTFATFDKTKSFVYRYYTEDLKLSKEKGVVNENSRYIKQRTKDQVWRRDQGKCVNCGSNKKLEFDHIIPVSKGGSSGYRNVQLLCENCNRRKSARIE